MNTIEEKKIKIYRLDEPPHVPGRIFWIQEPYSQIKNNGDDGN